MYSLYGSRRFRYVDERGVIRVCGDGENLRGQLDGVSLVVLRLCGPAGGLGVPRTGLLSDNRISDSGLRVH